MILDKELERCALNQVEDKFVEFPHEIYLKFSTRQVVPAMESILAQSLLQSILL